MNKQEYMKQLKQCLRRLPKEDFERAVEYYEEYFADAGSENEAKAIEDLGSPKEPDYMRSGAELFQRADKGCPQRHERHMGSAACAVCDAGCGAAFICRRATGAVYDRCRMELAAVNAIDGSVHGVRRPSDNTCGIYRTF